MSDADALALWLSSLDPETLDFVLQAAADAGGDSVFEWLPTNWQDVTGTPALPEAFQTWKERQQQQRVTDLIWFTAEGARQPGMADKAGFQSVFDLTRELAAEAKKSAHRALEVSRTGRLPLEAGDDPNVIIVWGTRIQQKLNAIGSTSGWSDKTSEWAEQDPLSRVGASGASPYKIDDQGGGDVQYAQNGPGSRLSTGAARGGRATEMDDMERARIGAAPRTRWDPDNLTPENLRELGTSVRGNIFNVRELSGDRLDAIQLSRDIAARAGYSSRTLTLSAPKDGLWIWDWGPNLRITHRWGQRTSSTPAMDIIWNGVKMKFHLTGPQLRNLP